MDKVGKAVAAVLILGAVFLLGALVPISTTYIQNEHVCSPGSGCQPCSSQDSLFSVLFGFPPVSTTCQGSEVMLSSTSHSG
jgi:hypothetical protein